MSLVVDVTLINQDKGYRFSEFEEETDFDSPGEVFRRAVVEYGRCEGKVWIDPPAGGPPVHVGWTFLSRQEHEDCSDTYLREAWVTLRDSPTEVRRERGKHVAASEARP